MQSVKSIINDMPDLSTPGAITNINNWTKIVQIMQQLPQQGMAMDDIKVLCSKIQAYNEHLEKLIIGNSTRKFIINALATQLTQLTRNATNNQGPIDISTIISAAIVEIQKFVSNASQLEQQKDAQKDLMYKYLNERATDPGKLREADVEMHNFIQYDRALIKQVLDRLYIDNNGNKKVKDFVATMYSKIEICEVNQPALSSDKNDLKVMLNQLDNALPINITAVQKLMQDKKITISDLYSWPNIRNEIASKYGVSLTAFHDLSVIEGRISKNRETDLEDLTKAIQMFDIKPETLELFTQISKTINQADVLQRGTSGKSIPGTIDNFVYLAHLGNPNVSESRKSDITAQLEKMVFHHNNNIQQIMDFKISSIDDAIYADCLITNYDQLLLENKLNFTKGTAQQHESAVKLLALSAIEDYILRQVTSQYNYKNDKNDKGKLSINITEGLQKAWALVDDSKIQEHNTSYIINTLIKSKVDMAMQQGTQQGLDEITRYKNLFKDNDFLSQFNLKMKLKLPEMLESLSVEIKDKNKLIDPLDAKFILMNQHLSNNNIKDLEREFIEVCKIFRNQARQDLNTKYISDKIQPIFSALIAKEKELREGPQGPSTEGLLITTQKLSRISENILKHLDKPLELLILLDKCVNVEQDKRINGLFETIEKTRNTINKDGKDDTLAIKDGKDELAIKECFIKIIKDLESIVKNYDDTNPSLLSKVREIGLKMYEIMPRKYVMLMTSISQTGEKIQQEVTKYASDSELQNFYQSELKVIKLMRNIDKLSDLSIPQIHKSLCASKERTLQSIKCDEIAKDIEAKQQKMDEKKKLENKLKDEIEKILDINSPWDQTSLANVIRTLAQQKTNLTHNDYYKELASSKRLEELFNIYSFKDKKLYTELQNSIREFQSHFNPLPSLELFQRDVLKPEMWQQIKQAISNLKIYDVDYLNNIKEGIKSLKSDPSKNCRVLLELLDLNTVKDNNSVAVIDQVIDKIQKTIEGLEQYHKGEQQKVVTSINKSVSSITASNFKDVNLFIPQLTKDLDTLMLKGFVIEGQADLIDELNIFVKRLGKTQSSTQESTAFINFKQVVDDLSKYFKACEIGPKNKQEFMKEREILKQQTEAFAKIQQSIGNQSGQQINPTLSSKQTNNDGKHI